MESYDVGTAVVDITPPVGTALSGNFRDDYASRGIHTPLLSRAVVIRSASSSVAIISSDVLTIPEAMVREIRRQVGRNCGISPDSLMVAATHTHSGPAVEPLATLDDTSDIQQMLIPGMVEACVMAWNDCTPTHLWRGTVMEDRVAFNRRLRLKDGSTVMNWTYPPTEAIEGPLGPVDPQIGVLLAGERPDQPCFVAADLSLHPAVMAGDNWLINPDWPGYYYEAIHKAFGRDTTVMFLQGTDGNINHIDAWDPLQGRGFKETQRIGSLVGLDVIDSVRSVQSISGPVCSSVEVLSVPPRRIEEPQLTWAKEVLAASMGEPPGQVDGIPDSVFATDQIKMASRQESYEVEIQVFRVGATAIIALPGEFFVEFGLAIKKASPAQLTMVVGLANGSVGYVPTYEAFRQGGYEPTPWRYSKLCPQAGEMCVDAAVAQLKRLFEEDQ
jgi:hypothetical protein